MKRNTADGQNQSSKTSHTADSQLTPMKGNTAEVENKSSKTTNIAIPNQLQRKKHG